MAINKVIYGGNTLMDITDTTAVANKVLASYYFYGRDGVKTQGTCTYNADTSDATATASEILTGSSNRHDHGQGTAVHRPSRLSRRKRKGADRNSRTEQDHRRQHQSGHHHPRSRGQLLRRSDSSRSEQELHALNLPAGHHTVNRL